MYAPKYSIIASEPIFTKCTLPRRFIGHTCKEFHKSQTRISSLILGYKRTGRQAGRQADRQINKQTGGSTTWAPCKVLRLCFV
jgi:hypothetical protein